jgi:hypothetical protein
MLTSVPTRHERSHSRTCVDAAFAVVASRCASVAELLELELDRMARTPAEPLRAASGALGRGLLRSAAGPPTELPSTATPLLDHRAGHGA